ncbi:DUF4433 domain-containing protein [Argonema antarcticum A004/B2]|nr:DarT ssDNA thymidine ADP-ribosyltransferase family protein [Argonema antarcticum]MCL1475166.1 DUF4433 domain-containing protein [Argonema antarcticum A004/B2]
MSIKNQKLLYHLTSIDNLGSILDNGLLARNDLDNLDDDVSFHDVADAEIISFRRANNLTIYIPFHFFAKNPFDGKVQKSYPNEEFMYISIQRTFAQKNNFKIIPKHPLSMSPLILYDYSDGMEKIDWETMDRRDYSDQNCKNICMAECLSQNKIEPQDFHAIWVRSEEAKAYVEDHRQNVFDQLRFYVNAEKNMFIGK